MVYPSLGGCKPQHGRVGANISGLADQQEKRCQRGETRTSTQRRSRHAGNKGRRVRSVPMSANVRAVPLPCRHGRSGEALVFEHEAKPGEPICGISLYRRFVSAAKRAGLPVLRFHDLRHSFGTQAIRAFNIDEVQRMMGHRHITTTERYLRARPGRCGEALRAVADRRRSGERRAPPHRHRMTVWGALSGDLEAGKCRRRS